MKSAGPTQDRRVRFSGAGSDGDSLLPGVSRSRFALFFVSSRGGKPNLANETGQFGPAGRVGELAARAGSPPAGVPGYQASPSGLLSSGGVPAASRSAL